MRFGADLQHQKQRLKTVQFDSNKKVPQQQIDYPARGRGKKPIIPTCTEDDRKKKNMVKFCSFLE